MIIKLVRIVSDPRGAFGVLILDGEIFAVTLEHTYISPDSPNAALSKIPPGDHPAERRMYFHGGYETFEIKVQGHSDILIHKANFLKDVDGCVGIAKKFSEFGSAFGQNPGVAESSEAFAEFARLTAGVNNFTLRVIDVVSIVGG